MLAAQQPCDQSGNSWPLAHGTKHRPRGSRSPPKLAMTSTRSQQPLSSSLTTASQQIQKPARTLKRNHGTVLGSFLCQALVRIGVPSGDTSPVCRHGPCKILHSLLRCQANHTALCKQSCHACMVFMHCNHATSQACQASMPTKYATKHAGQHAKHASTSITCMGFARPCKGACNHAACCYHACFKDMQSCNCKQHPINPKP